MSCLDRLDARYRLILCDLWGCVHNGVALYPGAARRLERWRGEGRTIVLLTNAPRTASAVAGQLAELGLSPRCWDSIATSGGAGIAAARKLGPVGFIGTAADRADLAGAGVEIAANDFTQLVCTGLDERRRTVADYEPQLRDLAERAVTMHCLNPDRVVVRGDKMEPCAGAIADRFVELGGTVEFYGKPYPAIYAHALELGGSPPRRSVLAIGDGLDTDILGAARQGFDCVFVSGGIHAGEDFPDDFAQRHDLGGWRPLAIVESLA